MSPKRQRIEDSKSEIQQVGEAAENAMQVLLRCPGAGGTTITTENAIAILQRFKGPKAAFKVVVLECLLEYLNSVEIEKETSYEDYVLAPEITRPVLDMAWCLQPPEVSWKLVPGYGF